MTPKDLEERLILFAVNIINMSEGIRPGIAGRNMADQIVRSCSSTALNYGEAQSARNQVEILSTNWEFALKNFERHTLIYE